MAIKFIRVADIPAGKIEWLWDQRIPIGGLTVLEGNPGALKSTLVADLAGRITMGRPMPFQGEASAQPPGNVIVINGEDSPHQLKIQLLAAGNDLRRVETLDSAKFGDDWAELLPHGLPVLEKAARKLQRG